MKIKTVLIVLSVLIANNLSSTPNLNTTSLNDKEITILFAYTTAATIEVGGHKKMKNLVDNGLKLLNEALENSQIGCKAVAKPKYVHVKDRNEIQDSRSTLNKLSKVNGEYNEIHIRREKAKADIVCLIVYGENNRTSIANLNGAFMVCTIDAFDDSYIFAHEFGHILGAQHASDVKSYNDQITYHDIPVYGGRVGFKTISNNGANSIPYFSDNRTIFHTIDGKPYSFKLGDSQYNNSAVMRSNMNAKANLGENLRPVSSVDNAISIAIVNPDKAQNPSGTKVPFKFIEFSIDESGNVVFRYECTKFYYNQRNQYKIEIIDPFGEVDNNTQYYLETGEKTITLSPFHNPYRPIKNYNGYKAILYYEKNGNGNMVKREEKIIGQPLKFVDPNDPSFITKFDVDINNHGKVTIEYKNTEQNVTVRLNCKGSDEETSRNITLKRIENTYSTYPPCYPSDGTILTLYINEKQVATYTVSNTDN